MKKVLLLVCVAIVTACAKPPNVNVRSTWGSNISRLGMVPIYPPDEDRYPGDVLIYVQNPCEGNPESPYLQSIFVDSIPTVPAAFLDFFGTRPQLPETVSPQKVASSASQQNPSSKVKPKKEPAKAHAPAAPAAAHPPAPAVAHGPTAPVAAHAPAGHAPVVPVAGHAPAPPAKAAKPAPKSNTQVASNKDSSASEQPSTGLSAQPIAPDTDPIFWTSTTSKRKINRLRLVAFPTLVIGSFTQEEVAANFPLLSALNIGIGGGVQQSTNITVTVSGTQEAEIPQLTMRALVDKYLYDQKTRSRINWGEAFNEVRARTAELMGVPGCKRRAVLQAPTLIVINRVFYATEFDFDYGQGSAAAAQIRAAIASSAAAASAKSTPGNSNSATDGTASSSSDATVSSSEQMATSLLKSLSALAGGATPGGGATLAYGTNGSVVLKKTFDRPLAFGADQTITYPLSEALCAIGGGSITLGGCASPALPPMASTTTDAISDQGRHNLLDLAAYMTGPTDPMNLLPPPTNGYPSTNDPSFPGARAFGPPSAVPVPVSQCPPNDLICESNAVKNYSPAPPPPQGNGTLLRVAPTLEELPDKK